MMDGHWTTVGGGGNRNFRVMSAFQAAAAAGFQAGGVGSTFPSAATFPHYAIQQGIPYNLYGYVYMLMYMHVYIYIYMVHHYLVMFQPFSFSLPTFGEMHVLCQLMHSNFDNIRSPFTHAHPPQSPLSLSLSPFWSIEQHMQEQLINEKRNELPDFYTNYIFHNVIAFCHYCAFSFSYRRTISHYSCMKNTHMYGPFSVHQYMQ